MADSQPTHAHAAPQLNETPVEYREVPGFPLYRVGSDGTAWSRFGRDGYGKKWKPITGSPTDKGYIKIILRTNDGRTCRISLHRAILTTFVGPAQPGQFGLHNNGNRQDNRLSNLRWGTAKENSADSKTHGTWIHGPRHGLAKVTNELLEQIKADYENGLSAYHLSIVYGLSIMTIYRIVDGRAWANLRSGDKANRQRWFESSELKRLGISKKLSHYTPEQIAKIAASPNFKPRHKSIIGQFWYRSSLVPGERFNALWQAAEAAERVLASRAEVSR